MTAQMRFYQVNTVYRRLATVHAVSYFYRHSQGTGSPLWIHGKADGIHLSLPIVSDSLYIHRWPSTHSISMVWQSLVSLPEDLQSLWAIYKSFLVYWDHYHPSTLLECPLIPSDTPLNTRFQYPPVMLPDMVHPSFVLWVQRQPCRF